MDDLEKQAWLDARAGYITASRIADVLTKPRKGQKESTTRRNYMAQLVCERLTGKSIEDPKGAFWDVKRGLELEPQARVEYEFKAGHIVDTAGFVKHPTILMAGATPDGLIGNDGMVQFKAPRTAIHLDWLRAGVVPSEHKLQMLFELACCPEREWSDFCSYESRLPEHLSLFIVRLKRDHKAIEEIEQEVRKFNAEIEEMIDSLPRADGTTALQVQLERSLEMATKSA